MAARNYLKRMRISWKKRLSWIIFPFKLAAVINFILIQTILHPLSLAVFSTIILDVSRHSCNLGLSRAAWDPVLINNATTPSYLPIWSPHCPFPATSQVTNLPSWVTYLVDAWIKCMSPSVLVPVCDDRCNGNTYCLAPNFPYFLPPKISIFDCLLCAAGNLL